MIVGVTCWHTLCELVVQLAAICARWAWPLTISILAVWTQHNLILVCGAFVGMFVSRVIGSWSLRTFMTHHEAQGEVQHETRAMACSV